MRLLIGDGGYDAVHIFEYILHRLRALPVITRNPRNAADPQADLATDTLCVLRRPSPWHKALFRSRTAVERTNSRVKSAVSPPVASDHQPKQDGGRTRYSVTRC